MSYEHKRKSNKEGCRVFIIALDGAACSASRNGCFAAVARAQGSNRTEGWVGPNNRSGRSWTKNYTRFPGLQGRHLYTIVTELFSSAISRSISLKRCRFSGSVRSSTALITVFESLQSAY